MKEVLSTRRSAKYLLLEMIPSFLLGVVTFVLILLMFQALRLTEFVLVHGVGWKTIGEIVLYLSVSFLPAILPMSLIFSILMTYGRLSNDSEIIALRSLGVKMMNITLPALFLSFLVAISSAYTLFEVGPWGNRQFEVLISKLGRQKATSQIRGGTFSEGFFDLVVYANEVENESGKLLDVFIYDERNEDLPVTIIAKEGQILQDTENFSGFAQLKLLNGNMHRNVDGKYQRLNFKSYIVNLSDSIDKNIRKKSPPSLTYDELQILRHDTGLKPKDQRKYQTEYHKRWAISFACLIFGLLGVGLGTVPNRRSARSSGLVLSLGVIVGYWTVYVTMEGLARAGHLPVALAIWIPNVLFLGFSYFALKRVWD